MKSSLLGVMTLFLMVSPIRAHFIWIVPDAAKDGQLKVVFSDDLEPDEGVSIDKIAGTKLLARDGTGKVNPIAWKKDKHAFLVSVAQPAPDVIGGVCLYGVSQRGKMKPFLLAYYPKLIRGELKAGSTLEGLALEIVPRGVGRFQVLFNGKPAAGADVVVVDAGKKPMTTDASGEFQIELKGTGWHGIRARHIEAKAGEHEGKKYEEARHYATLVFQAPKVQPKQAAPDAKQAQPSATEKAVESPYPLMSKPISSFGAAVCDGWLYVYGGHLGQAHQYSTEAVSNTFVRLNLSNGKEWEKLPSGPGAQGLALVCCNNKIYRIGGMQPRNKPGEKADNHSLASCTCYDPAKGKWESLPDMPAGRSSHDAVVIGDKIYVVGGWKLHGRDTAPEWHNSGLVLDLSAKAPKWQSFKQPFQRRALAAAAHEGKVYVMGGLTEGTERELTTVIYDPTKDVWTSGKDIPPPSLNAFSPAACVRDGRLFLNTSDGKLWRLSVKGDAWEESGTVQQPRFVHRMVPGNARQLVVIGGASRGGSVATAEVVEPTVKK